MSVLHLQTLAAEAADQPLFGSAWSIGHCDNLTLVTVAAD